jgi:hypothetical protein
VLRGTIENGNEFDANWWYDCKSVKRKGAKKSIPEVHPKTSVKSNCNQTIF